MNSGKPRTLVTMKGDLPNLHNAVNAPPRVIGQRYVLLASIALNFFFLVKMELALPFISAVHGEISPVTSTGTTIEQEDEEEPLQVYPLLKELRAGWSNMQSPPLLRKKANGTRSLVIDIGLDEGKEFFEAMDNGFEVVGFEANPVTFLTLAARCIVPQCFAIPDISAVDLPLQRQPGASYLVNAGVGETDSILSFHPNGPVGTFTSNSDTHSSASIMNVTVIAIDKVIQEDVYLLKIDTQGFEYAVLKGAANLFHQYIVRQVILEVDSKLLASNNVAFMDLVSLISRDYGMICFTSRDDFILQTNTRDAFGIHADLAEGMYKEHLEHAWSASFRPGEWWGMWDDFLCINRKKAWMGPTLQLI